MVVRACWTYRDDNSTTKKGWRVSVYGKRGRGRHGIRLREAEVTEVAEKDTTDKVSYETKFRAVTP